MKNLLSGQSVKRAAFLMHTGVQMKYVSKLTDAGARVGKSSLLDYVNCL